MHNVVILILSFILICCQPPLSPEQKGSFKDSVIKRHLAKIDSLDFYDTLDRDYKTLKAYINDDTVFFNKMNKDMDITEKYMKEEPGLDTCVHLTKLSELSVDEAYRFSHGQSFCDYGQKITITRSGDEVRLHFVEYSNGNGITSKFLTVQGDTFIVKPYCTVAKEFKKTLSMKDWEELERRLYEADYWGLKSYHYELSTDGSSWEIEAYTKRSKEPEGQQIHFVTRHCSCNSAFKQLGNYFLKLSGEKTMCGEFF